MAKPPRTWRDPILLAILAGSLVLNTREIDHPGLHYFDESFHAIVARNLLKHPLKPTLIDVPYLAYDPTHWGENHVWLHKPILPLWTIAASYAVLGVNTLALRLPSAILATASVALTFLIGRRLFDRRTGLIAAALQAICPAILMLVQGYLFSDHIDISLLFWVEFGVYFVVRSMQTGAWSDVLLVGVAQGLAYLSKSYLAALLTGLAATAWLLPRMGMMDPAESRWKLRHLGGMVAATLATVAPWMIYCAWAFPVEFAHEHGYVFTHVGKGVENWGGPWDRLFFDYLIALYHSFYTPFLAAGLVMAGVAVRTRRTPLWFLFAWLIGVLAPHAVAATKTPSATLIAMPAGFLLLARLMAEGWHGRLRPLATWAAIMVVVAIVPSRIGRFGRGFPQPPVFGGVMMGALWVFEHVTIAAAIVGVIELLDYWASQRRPGSSSLLVPTLPRGNAVFDALRRLSARPRRSEEDAGASGTAFPRRTVGTRMDRTGSTAMIQILRVAALASTLVVGFRVTRTAWSVTDRSEDQPFVNELAGFARDRLPKNAVLLFDDGGKGDFQVAMFLLDRTCYLLQGRPLDAVASRIREAGGIPYVVTAAKAAPWPLRFAASNDPRALYEWQSPTEVRQVGMIEDP